MSEVTKDQLDTLAPYVAGAQPDARGEIEIYCPMHPDTKRSASVNVRKGAWYCHAGCGGGSVRQLILGADGWVPLEGRGALAMAPPVSTSVAVPTRVPTHDEIRHWHLRLRREQPLARALYRKRNVTMATIRRAQLGWNGKQYTIPVFSPSGRVWNVRKYDPNPRPGYSKIWNTRGLGQPRLYPASVLSRARYGSDVFAVEGEFDTLLALQYGEQAVTRTDGAGKPWHDEWTEAFAGLNVYLCYDQDNTGQRGEQAAAEALVDVANVFKCMLPFEMLATGGPDLTDYLKLHHPLDRSRALADLKKGSRPV